MNKAVWLRPSGVLRSAQHRHAEACMEPLVVLLEEAFVQDIGSLASGSAQARSSGGQLANSLLAQAPKDFQC